MIAELIGALAASVYGCCTVFRRKTPLFYRILFFAVLTCLMGNVYTVLYGLLWQPAEAGFHVGYLGYIGMFFFLYSSYYGAIDSLADGKQPELRRYRLTAGIAAAAFFIGSVLLMVFSGKAFWMYLVVIPMGFTAYFAMKHLIIPDVEMGIIQVMRPYNAVIIGLCVSMMLRMISVSGSVLETVSSICTGLLRKKTGKSPFAPRSHIPGGGLFRPLCGHGEGRALRRHPVMPGFYCRPLMIM